MMDNKQEIRISVRSLVEFVMRSGSLDSRYLGMTRMAEGTRGHKKVQKQYNENDRSEVSLSHRLEFEKLALTVEGRADGILCEEGSYILDEIKTVNHSLDDIDETYNPSHWAQAKCYGYIFSESENLAEIIIQLTYYQLDTGDVKQLRQKYTYTDLKAHFDMLVEKYVSWASFSCEWMLTRDQSIKDLQFPYDRYRRGQRDLAVTVYRTLTHGRKLFAQAPTGIGKTISVLFPSVKAMGEGHTSKIFYLTAKTTTQSVVEDTLFLMKSKGLRLKSITLTAKDKACFKEHTRCNPEYCEYAEGYFDRVNQAVLDLIKSEDILSREVITQYAEKHRVCPFEYALDLSLWADCIICDYNYVFDPNASLKRYFSERSGDYTFLVDEAHNLVDRAREMFSASLSKKTFLDMKREIKNYNKKLYKSLDNINKYMILLRKSCSHSNHAVKNEEETELYKLLRKFSTDADSFLSSSHGFPAYETLLGLYFDVLSFLKISELYDERYVTFLERSRNDISIKLFCLDPALLISQTLKKGRAAVFFSATLLPMDYFKDVLGNHEEDGTIYLNSPFDARNRCLMLANDISTRFVNREESYDRICKYIYETVKEKEGNYMIFFPSYKYLNEVYSRFAAEYQGYNTYVQLPAMSDADRIAFIEAFKPNPDKTHIGFCVMGGIYSEGIDLTDDRLIGVIIIGVGLPLICPERDIIRDYYQQKNQMGYEYAYMFPGMNKVMQAAGRLIRSETDKGIILLIDDRFVHNRYQQLFPKEWFPHKTVRINSVSGVISKFWQKF